VKNFRYNMFHPFLIVDKSLPKVLVSGELLSKMRFVDEEGNEFLSEKISTALKNYDYHHIFDEMTREFYLKSFDSKIFACIGCSEEYFEKYKKENEFGWIFSEKSLSQVKRFEIHPAFHYSLGGIVIDGNCATNKKNVFAAGECSTGLHGTNRIGGFAVSEAVLHGKVAAESVLLKPDLFSLINNNENDVESGNLEMVGDSHLSAEFREIMWGYFGSIKHKSKLIELKNKILVKQVKNSDDVFVLKMIDDSLLYESKGLHYVLD
ncbi:MAG: FAD-binding protein, partial [Candidatus Diapherotrites archaeon]|nr:FAD-binding protein [Candidatus Diapherotrites archaeon]